MIADLMLYPECKDTRLPWLGKVPEHWELRCMKFLFKERNQKGFPNEPLLAATQSKGVVRKEDYGLPIVTAVNGLDNLKLVEIGDFVISLRSFQGGIEVSYAPEASGRSCTLKPISPDLSPGPGLRSSAGRSLIPTPGRTFSMTGAILSILTAWIGARSKPRIGMHAKTANRPSFS